MSICEFCRLFLSENVVRMQLYWGRIVFHLVTAWVELKFLHDWLLTFRNLSSFGGLFFPITWDHSWHSSTYITLLIAGKLDTSVSAMQKGQQDLFTSTVGKSPKSKHKRQRMITSLVFFFNHLSFSEFACSNCS